jgi:fibronectin type III domain protein
MRHIKVISLLIFFCTYSIIGYAQQKLTSEIRGRAEIQSNRILLRWIPTDAESWALLNEYGVRLERLTVFRSGTVLNKPEVRILANILKPMETEKLKELAGKYPMGAVIAQAIFGEDFEISLGESPLSKAIALDEARQQRYLFSLYAADLCFSVAKEVGWGWEDTDIRDNERYLYRITPLVPKKKRSITQGAIFAVPADTTKLVSPMGLSIQCSEAGAQLTWDYNTLSYLYSAYFVERSEDGIHFKQISELPVTRMADTDKNPYAPITYLDSIPLGKTMYYRVVGVTPFGSRGDYSSVVSGIAYPALKVAPMITSSQFDNLGGADIIWEFDDKSEDLINCFNILHSTDEKHYDILASDISSQSRKYHIEKINKYIYYKVEAKAKQGAHTQSLPILIQPIDSVPPAIPQGLKAHIDSLGAVHLSWDANHDADIYGYRLYRGQTKGEELIPITDVAIRETYYTDSVNINNLNDKVYYALTSLDERYNQSEQCQTIEVFKPQTIPPTAPIIIKGIAEAGKNIIEWASGREPQLVGFIVARTDMDGETEQRVQRIANPKATEYEDNDIESGKTYQYQVMAYSANQQYSSLSFPVKIKSLKEENEKDVAKFDLEVLPEGIAIKWNIPYKDILSVTLYKLDETNTKFLYREGLPSTGTLTDGDIYQNRENEYMLIVKSKGRKTSNIIKKIHL